MDAGGAAAGRLACVDVAQDAADGGAQVLGAASLAGSLQLLGACRPGRLQPLLPRVFAVQALVLLLVQEDQY